MVLSNKKLKQKLRAAKAELITASQAENNNASSRDIDSKTSLSLGTMLNLETLKPSLSKREKRRQNAVQENGGVIGNGEMSGGDVKPIQDGLKVDSVQVKKKKKRKRDEHESSENGQEKKLQQMKKKKKKKKNNKKKKPNNKVEDGKVKEEGIDRNENGNTGKQLVVNTNEGTHRKNVEISSKVYVGGIPYYSTEDDIKSYFEGCGTITCIDCMTFPDTGKFRGIAIITFKTEAAAKRALAFDGSDMGGLFLKIQPFKAAKADKSPDFCPSVLEGYNRIYVGNLSWDISEDDLKKLFADCTIKSIRFGEDKETGEFKGYAHVDFADNLSLNRALKLDQMVVCGRPVKISCAVPKKGNITKLTSTPKDDQVDTKQGNTTELEATQKDYKVDNSSVNVDFENQVITSEANAVSSKVRRRTCYECGERGHLSSSCPKGDQVDSGKQGNATELEATQKDKVNNSNFNVDFENQVITSETNAVSSKIRRRTCYECGERGHLSSSCPKGDQVDSGKQGNTIELEATKKDNKISYVNVNFENQVPTSETNAVSSKIRRRTCYKCGERGHLSSSCPKDDQVDSGKQGNITELEATQKDNKVDNSNVNVGFENQVIASEPSAVSSKIRRRTCYECGERGHLSSSCPKKQAADLTNQGTA